MAFNLNEGFKGHQLCYFATLDTTCFIWGGLVKHLRHTCPYDNITLSKNTASSKYGTARHPPPSSPVLNFWHRINDFDIWENINIWCPNRLNCRVFVTELILKDIMLIKDDFGKPYLWELSVTLKEDKDPGPNQTNLSHLVSISCGHY